MNRLVHAFQSRRRESRPQTAAIQSTTDSLSSSSDGSVPTPEDDPDASARSSSRFAKWLRSSSSSSSSKPSSISTKQKPFHPTAVWSPPQDPGVPSDSEDDDSDNYGEDTALSESLPPTPPPPPLPRPPPIPASSPIRASSRSPGRPNRTLLDRSHQNLRDITLSAINHRPPCPPFLHAPSGRAFPRSSNPSPSLPVVQTTRIVHLKTNIIRRLEANSLTRAEHESITPFYSRSKHNHSVLTMRRRLDLEDVSDIKDTKRVQSFSHGLQRWINRPCFEERCVAWYWDSDGKEVVSRSIPGSGKAVALLEFSEGLEAMAGFGLAAPASGWPGEISTRLPSLTIPPVPRLDSQTTGSSNPSPGPATPKNASPSATARKALRFVPDYFAKDDGDNVPLGIHLSRREEQEREDKKKKTLAEEVAKARMRADAVRTGAADKERLYDTRRTYTRPIYDTHASTPSLSAVTPAVKRGPDMLDASARKPFNVRSSTWNGDIPQRQFSSTHLPPPLATNDSSEGTTKGQRRTSMLISAARSDTGGHTSSSRLRPTVVPPVIPAVPVPMQMQMQAHPSHMYPFQLQPMVPIAPSAFMQSRFMVPSSPIFDQLALPPPPPIRAGIPVSRSAERLIPSSSSAYSAGKSTTAARRTTVGAEELKQLAEQMKRSGFYPEQLGRSNGTTTGRLKETHESRHLGGREERSEGHRKVGVDPRSQSGRMEEQKRMSRMPSASMLPHKQSNSRLVPR